MPEPVAAARPRLQVALTCGVLIMLALLLATAAWQWRHGPPVTSSLLDLMPRTEVPAREQQANDRMQVALNRELVLLVGAPQRAQGIALLHAAEKQLRASGLFAEVRATVQADLPALRDDLLRGRLALLPPADRQRLLSQPEAFLAQRAADLLDPFAAAALVSPTQDWLGLTQRIQSAHARVGAVGLDVASGLLAAEDAGQTWFLLQARSGSASLDMGQAAAVAALVEAVKQYAASQGGQVLATSGLLYAAQAQDQATAEMGWLGGGSVLGIVLLLLLAFRRWRSLLALAPVLAGLLAGSVACVLALGNIHVMTLVIGSTLIGVATDYPLHYLGKSYGHRAGRPAWTAWPALWWVLPGLTLSLLTSVIGYLALAFTSLPALRQLAVFSAAGLVAAYACTVALLPWAFGSAPPRPWPALSRAAGVLLQVQVAWRAWLARGHRRWLLAVTLLAVASAGGWRLQFHDDLRNWISSPAALVQESRDIARITGFQPTSQFFLVEAADESQLLARLAVLSGRLDTVTERGDLQSYDSLDQLVAPAPEQQRLRGALAALAQSPLAWQPLLALGIEPRLIAAELQTLQALPTWRIDEALQTVPGERWRPLWLGGDAQGVAAVVRLQGLRAGVDLSSLGEGLPGVRWVDRLAELNEVFSHTRVSAALLKLLSCGVILALLWPVLGLRVSACVLAVPLLAAAASLATLGWLGQPLTLFGLFGLLLVTAIGVDYAIFMHEAVGGQEASLVGILLAAATTLLSFGLLALSRTPAVSSFGLCVALGIAYCLVLAPWVRTVSSRGLKEEMTS
ncbi:MAG: hypothetical protein GAK30_00732 [Paracidovorax wautersii]|uniref:Membrane transport protein MMPL domain-containing protein n=1 Tax=Paracidovorax wautersii TaxID=1177982 RepID=A0A7V8JRL2_9BURK|nr:MAG: hypothetical protein GAK30_00732 [Paracidovorax wautersii]